MPETPSCCDGPNELLRKILLEFIALGTGVPASLYPRANDGPTILYRKILLTLPYI